MLHDAVVVKVPRMLSWFRALYMDPATLVLANGDVLTSEEGVHQGGPCSGDFYSMGMESLFEDHVQVMEDLDLRAWFLDDGTLGGDWIYWRRWSGQSLDMGRRMVLC